MSNTVLSIKPNSVDEELDRIGGTLAKMDWFREHGYTPKLPDIPESTNSKEDLLKLVTSDYNPEIYQAGIRSLEAHREQIEAVFPTFEQLKKAWGFKTFPEYEISVTRYGTGGSYDPNTGKIIMRVNDDGTFARAHPHHTPIHEMVHIGIDECIIKNFQLTQAEKERMVDLMVSILFANLLPDYRFQPIGDTSIDPVITTETIANLPQAIKHYVETHPR